MPTVSVIMPTYNRAHLISRAISSVRNQTFRDWELLVVDDGSTDNTEEVVRGFHDPRIRYIEHTQNRGAPAARNTGIRNAKGSYLAYIDDDDEWLPEKLERQLALFQSSSLELGVVGCGRLNYTRRGFKKVLPKVSGWIFEDLLAGRATGCGTPLLMVKCFGPDEEILFDESFPAFEERDYLLRIARSHPMDFVGEPLIKVYRNDGGPHVANVESAVKAYALLMQKYATELQERPLVMRYYLARLARELAALGRIGEARSYLAQAIKIHKTSPRLYLWLAASWFGPLGVNICSRLLPVAPAARRIGESPYTRDRQDKPMVR